MKRRTCRDATDIAKSRGAAKPQLAEDRTLLSGEIARLGHGVPWIRTWVLGLTLFGTVLACGEYAWRSLGYRPSVADSPALWKFWYERAATAGPKSIVLIGASRIQTDVSTDRMRTRLPDYEIIQLGQYAGGSPIGVLRALAMDRRFNGTVICDLLAPFLIRERWTDQCGLYESPANIGEQVDAYRMARSADLLVVRNVESGIGGAVKHLLERGRLPSPNHVRMRPDRSLEIDFAVMESLKAFREKNAASFRRQYQNAEVPAPEELDDEFNEVDSLVNCIQDRGGQVIFLRMPSSGERLKIEEQYHPKAKYWNRFAATSSGICIHWTEIDGASGFVCPDESHLDYQEATRFTDLLVDALIKRGCLRNKR